MIPLLLLALVQEETPTRDTVHEALRYVVSHQAPDGSWGERVQGCRCPKTTEASSEAEIREFVEQLGDASPGVREKAADRLLRIGPVAAPHLREAVRSDDKEVRTRAASILKAFPREHASSLRLTSLCVLFITGAGYCVKDRTKLSGRGMGEVFRGALDWLIGKQRQDGSFSGGSPVESAMAALALSGCLQLADQEKVREAARKAIGFIERTEEEETEFLVWKGMALKAAEELTLREDQTEAILGIAQTLEKRKGTLAVLGSTLLRLLAVGGKPGEQRRAELIALAREDLTDTVLYLAQVTALLVDGAFGPVWKSFCPLLRDLAARQNLKGGGRHCEWGSWSGPTFRGRVCRTALSGLSLAAYKKLGYAWK